MTEDTYASARKKFLGFSLESSRKSYYPQLQKQLESARKNERRLQLLIDNLPARISYLNKDKRFVLANRQHEKVFGRSPEEMIGCFLGDIIGEENFRRVEPYVDEALTGVHIQFETVYTFPNGDERIYDISYVPVFEEEGSVDGIYVLILDITEQKQAAEEKARLETRLNDVQKFKAIGTLAGGIAHDFNNLMMGIQGRASLMAVNLDEDHPQMEHVRAIEEYVRSATNLTRQLLGFARGGKYEVKPIDLNRLLNSSAEMFGRTRKEIRIKTRLSESALVVDVDGRQIEQVLLNLYVNAWQAMPEGGTLYLETKPVFLDEHYCSPYELEPGHYARIMVTDTGIGMTEEVRRRVFDPFFTTKEKQRGTGLGLASAYGIIKNHGGLITVYSEPEVGSTFNIYLPLSEHEEPFDEQKCEELQRGMETILLVDDEKMILDVGQAMLETLGYKTTIAETGEKTLDILQQEDKKFNLIILDMIMPGMDGGTTFDRIKEIEPDIPVLLSSGYSINGQAEEIIQRGCSGFIQKPFNIAELSVQVRKALKSRASDI